MSIQVQGNIKTFKAVADYSAKQFYIMKCSAAGEITIASAATDFLIGTLTNKPKLGENGSVSLRNACGTAKVVAGGNITLGAKLTSDANGKAIVTTTGNDLILGYAMQTGVDGDVIEYAPCFDIVSAS